MALERLASPWGRRALYFSCLLGAALVTWRGLDSRVPAALLFAGLAFVLGVVAAGVLFQGSGVFARPLQSVEGAGAFIAITIDDGPDPSCTPALLDALEEAGQRATFFVIGERAERHPALLREIAARGHAVENHSLRHSWATPFTPVARLTRELERASALIEAATGRKPRWFRAPVGLLSPRVASASQNAGLRLVGWTATARDGVERTSLEQALARLENGLVPGAILVLHDARPGGPELLARLLARLEARKLRSVTLDELVRGGG